MAGQKDFTFSPVKPGDPVTADAWNEIGMQVMRLGGALGMDSISTGAGVFLRKKPSTSTSLSFFYLNEPLYRTLTGGAEANTTSYSSATGEWTDSGTANDTNIYGDFSTGYWFAGDLVAAMKSTDANRWYAIGCGHTLARGVLDQNINMDGQSANVEVYEWSSAAEGWSDASLQVLAWEALGIASPIASGSRVVLEWHEQGQIWIVTGASCE